MTFKHLLFLTCFALVFALVPTTAAAQSKLSPELRQEFAQNGQADYLIVFSAKPDLGDAPAITDLVARRRLVYDRLRQQALGSQAEALASLQSAALPYRQHYLLNALEVTSDLSTAQQLAALPGVERLASLKPMRTQLPQPDPSRERDAESPATTNVEWGISRVHAPEVWNTFNTRGEGIVVGTADTGVQWDHPALKAHYRGWDGSTATHAYNWHDAIHTGGTSSCGVDIVVPCDDYGHGTHVTGTLAGDDGAGNQIGVAPGAKWIGCRNMDDGNGTIARYTECFEFMLAPYPFGGDPLTDGRPDLAADIVNNSWACVTPPAEDCSLANLNDMRSEVQKLNAAGIMVVAAAGNAGPGCSSVQFPIAIYPETFAAGATDSGDSIASFSSRGPVTIDGSNRRKPDLSAPGVNVRSSFPPNIYANEDGTSMASPHVSGVIALLWSAVPSLRGDIQKTTALLQMSADHMTTSQGCGGDTTTSVPNNTFGYGIVNAYAAVSCAPDGLCLDKQVSTGTVHVGDVITYTIHASNVSFTTTSGVLIADRVPTSTTYTAASIRGIGADDGSAPLLHWHIGDLPPREVSGTLTLSFAAQINVRSGGVISNTAHVESNQIPSKTSNIVSTAIQYLMYFPIVVR
jgi:serine protease AprX